MDRFRRNLLAKVVGSSQIIPCDEFLTGSEDGTKDARLTKRSRVSENRSTKDGPNIRCSRCVKIVSKIETLQLGPAQPHGGKGDMAPRAFKVDMRNYTPSRTCSACSENISLSQYHRLGHNLLEAHQADRTKPLPEGLVEGCCFLCVLMIQIRCRLKLLNGSSETERMADLGLGLTLLYPEWNEIILIGDVDWIGRQELIFPHVAVDATRAIDREHARVVPRSIHWPLLKSWLYRCENTHTRDCGKLLLDAAAPRVRNRTYINVQTYALVESPHDSRYIALSYVWGRVPQLLMTSSNRELLFRKGSLKSMRSTIPQVIRDAISVVQCLGETLLWVDSLCIVQDDKTEKHVLISEMASIYDQALVTIVAAHGENANASLPGVSQNTRDIGQCVQVPGIDVQISSRESLSTLMAKSIYDKRGWTFQERLLSRRCLYFTGQQVYFECQELFCSEDRAISSMESLPEDDDRPTSGNLIKRNLIEFGDPLASEEDRQLRRYSKIIQEYTRKQLSFSEDILNAFAGIGASLEQLCCWKLTYGLPMQILDRALLWEQNLGTSPREGYESRFPTWSWSAWIGGVDYSEWTASEIHIHHGPFELVHSPSGVYPQNILPWEKPSPSILRLSTSEVVPFSAFNLRIETYREKEVFLLKDSLGNSCGTIPGVRSSFIDKYQKDSLSFILLSSSELSLHRFTQLEDFGYPAIFNRCFSRDRWSVLTVMLVKWNGQYANRLALAYIHKEAWNAASWSVSDVLLG